MKIYFTTLILFVAVFVACVQAKPRKRPGKKLCHSDVDMNDALNQMRPFDFLNIVPTMECLARSGYDPCGLPSTDPNALMESCGSEIMSAVEKLPGIFQSQQDTAKLDAMLDAIHDEKNREKRHTGTRTTGTGTRRTGRTGLLLSLVRVVAQLASAALTCIASCLGTNNAVCILRCLGRAISIVLPLLS